MDDKTKKLKGLAKIIGFLLLTYLLIFRTGFVFTVLCISFLVVIGVVLLGDSIKKYFD
jgi:energy-coupling factor transporter transmembrane protein EcfT